MLNRGAEFATGVLLTYWFFNTSVLCFGLKIMVSAVQFRPWAPFKIFSIVYPAFFEPFSLTGGLVPSEVREVCSPSDLFIRRLAAMPTRLRLNDLV